MWTPSVPTGRSGTSTFSNLEVGLATSKARVFDIFLLEVMFFGARGLRNAGGKNLVNAATIHVYHFKLPAFEYNAISCNRHLA